MSDTSAAKSHNAKFVTGSTMRHVLVMTSTSSIGLMTLFMVDFADLYFLSLLGEIEVAAAIGYAGTILFFTTSVGIGLSIAASALVSKAVGAGDMDRARRYVVNAHAFTLVISIMLCLVLWPQLCALLDVLGAKGRAHDLALSYLQIIIPSLPMLALGMTSTGVLRAVGDAKRAMYITLIGGATNAVLDPIFIFALDLGVDGAAIASVGARVAIMGVGFYGVVHIHKLVDRMPSWGSFKTDIVAILAIASPAILTNVATPVGNSYVTFSISAFGDSAVAGWAIIGRIIPVAFGGIFALSGAIGPILGQNLGAKKFDRLERGLSDALLFSLVYMVVVWVILALSHKQISAIFGVDGEAAYLIEVFCLWLSPAFAFMGALFVANAAFNNLGRPHYSTMFNWGRATVGTVPLVYFGGVYFGSAGVIAGNLMGGLFFGTAAVLVCYRLIEGYKEHPEDAKSTKPKLLRRIPLWPFSTPRG